MPEIAVNKTSGEIQQYNPKESVELQNQAEAALDYYKRVKDLDGVRRAIEAVVTERHKFVKWWDRQEKDKGGGNVTGNRSVTSEGKTKLSDINLNKMVVSRWRQKYPDKAKCSEWIET